MKFRELPQNVFTGFLEALHVKFTYAFSDKYFREHPHKYNLLGLSQMLSDYGILNAGTKITDKENDIFDIELPFVAHTGSDFVTVYNIEPDKVHYLWNGKKIIISVQQFIQQWSGTILLAETTPDSIEPDYATHRKKELLTAAQKSILVLTGILFLCIAYINHSLFTNVGITLLLLVNLVGVYICSLLVMKQMHIHSQYADKICSLFSKSDCNNVLESDAAKLWGIFGWSEIGLGYFVANLVVLLFLPQLMAYFATINILALPYTVWSVWYQKVRARQWCPLCLVVQCLLWSLFILNGLFGYIQFPGFHIQELLIIGCIYAIPVLLFNLVIPQLAEGKQVEQLRQEINSLKANNDVFKSLLSLQPYYEVTKSDSQIILGNPDASLMITILTNPFCNPCAKMHARVEKLLKETKGKIGVQYIFSSFHKNLEYANKYLIATFLEKERREAIHLLNDWFNKGKELKEQFFEYLSLDIGNPSIEVEFDKHESWKAKTQLRATPTILVNGYKLPENYKIEGLLHFTELEFDSTVIAEVKVGSNPENKGFNINI